MKGILHLDGMKEAEIIQILSRKLPFYFILCLRVDRLILKMVLEINLMVVLIYLQMHLTI
nr:MAG TPA: hypothetical protein [Caudoviricetes sp.]